MANKSKKKTGQEGKPIVNVKAIAEKAFEATDALAEKAAELKESAENAKQELEDKLNELDNALESSITAYNKAYAQMNDKGIALYVERNRGVDTVAFVEKLVNSIANKPKSFDADFEEIAEKKKSFNRAGELAKQELDSARKAGIGAGAGLAAGTAVAYMAEATAMWVATTFGTASTGTAISALTGAAAKNAALAWLGGGGVAGGSALLALCGPVGVTVAGTTLLSTIVVYTKSKMKLKDEKHKMILEVRANTARAGKAEAAINQIMEETKTLRNNLNDMLVQCMSLYGADYSSLNTEKKRLLGALVNNTKALSAIFDKTIGEK